MDSGKELSITVGQVRAMAADDPDVEAVLREGFPEAFEDEWVDVTDKVKLEVEYEQQLPSGKRWFGLGASFDGETLYFTVVGGNNETDNIRLVVNDSPPEDCPGQFRIEVREE